MKTIYIVLLSAFAILADSAAETNVGLDQLIDKISRAVELEPSYSLCIILGNQLSMRGQKESSAADMIDAINNYERAKSMAGNTEELCRSLYLLATAHHSMAFLEPKQRLKHVNNSRLAINRADTICVDVEVKGNIQQIRASLDRLAKMGDSEYTLEEERSVRAEYGSMQNSDSPINSTNLVDILILETNNVDLMKGPLEETSSNPL